MDPAKGPVYAGVSNKIRGRARSLARYSSNSWRLLDSVTLLTLFSVGAPTLINGI